MDEDAVLVLAFITAASEDDADAKSAEEAALELAITNVLSCFSKELSPV